MLPENLEAHRSQMALTILLKHGHSIEDPRPKPQRSYLHFSSFFLSRVRILISQVTLPATLAVAYTPDREGIIFIPAIEKHFGALSDHDPPSGLSNAAPEVVRSVRARN